MSLGPPRNTILVTLATLGVLSGCSNPVTHVLFHDARFEVRVESTTHETILENVTDYRLILETTSPSREHLLQEATCDESHFQPKVQSFTATRLEGGELRFRFGTMTCKTRDGNVDCQDEP